MDDCEIRYHTNLTTVRDRKLSKFDCCLLKLMRVWQEVQNLKWDNIPFQYLIADVLDNCFSEHRPELLSFFRVKLYAGSWSSEHLHLIGCVETLIEWSEKGVQKSTFSMNNFRPQRWSRQPPWLASLTLVCLSSSSLRRLELLDMKVWFLAQSWRSRQTLMTKKTAWELVQLDRTSS